MPFCPELKLGLTNGWVPLVVFFLGLAGMVSSFPPDKRRKLFLEPSYPIRDWRWAVRLLGRLSAVSFVVLMVFTPLNLEFTLFYFGLIVYGAGFYIVMVSLSFYRRAPEDELVRRGPYRLSRNPQWVGLTLVFLGSVFMVAAWLPLLLNLVLILTYHFQILLEENICLEQYGETYNQYQQRVPRYFFRW